MVNTLTSVRPQVQRLQDNLGTVIVGKHEAIQLVLVLISLHAAIFTIKTLPAEMTAEIEAGSFSTHRKI